MCLHHKLVRCVAFTKLGVTISMMIVKPRRVAIKNILVCFILCTSYLFLGNPSIKGF
jgi:hypothetical protein